MRYRGRRVALLTQHGKERLLAPVLDRALGCRVERIGGFDTDRLGTFTREIPRPGTQIETARRKARIGMRLSGARLGLASEGGFGADPYTGMLPWNTELVVFIDDELGVEVAGIAHGPTLRRHGLVHDWAGLRTLAGEAGFPAHRLVLRPEHEGHPELVKGIDTWAGLRVHFDALRARSANGAVFAESDLRAHCNPTRQALIRQAGEDLARRLTSECPACASPGFWVAAHLPGLPCRWCAEPTSAPGATQWLCPRCGHDEQRAVKEEAADPGHCPRCNP